MKKSQFFSRESMQIEKLPAIFFLAVLLWVTWNLLTIVRPFIMVLVFSAITATVTAPIFVFFEKKFRGKKRLASLVTCLIVSFSIIIPLTFFITILVSQLIDLVKILNEFLRNTDFNSLMVWDSNNFFYDFIEPYRAEILAFIKQNLDTLKNGLTQLVQIISSFAAKQSATFLTNIGLFIFNFLLMQFTLYYLYKDGRKILRKLILLTPMPIEHEKVLIKKFVEISKATVFGTFLTHLTQGIIGYIGFAIAGVPNSFFWAVILMICSLVPTVGTSLVWLPMGLFMIFTGNWWGAFVLIWGATVVSTVDNVLRVIFIGSSARLNPLLTFLTVFGGILTFGLIGVILGPMFLVIFMTLLHVYELEYEDLFSDKKQLGFDEPHFEKKT